MKTRAVKWIERRRYGKPLAFVLGLLCCGLFLVTPLAAVAAPIYMDDFEDGDSLGWLETIVPGSGGSGSTGVEFHNGSQMAYVYHRGRGEHSLSHDFNYVADNILSFDMQAVSTSVTIRGATLHARAGIEMSFLNFVNVPLGSINLVNATNPGSLGAGYFNVDATPNDYTGSMSDFAALAGLDASDPISKMSLSFYATGNYNWGGNIYPNGYSSGTVWFDNVTIDPVPIPSAVWLFGSGLIGLVGLTRRKKSA